MTEVRKYIAGPNWRVECCPISKWMFYYLRVCVWGIYAQVYACEGVKARGEHQVSCSITHNLFPRGRVSR